MRLFKHPDWRVGHIEGITLLSTPCSLGRTKAARVLLGAGADPNLKCGKGECTPTILHAASPSLRPGLRAG